MSHLGRRGRKHQDKAQRLARQAEVKAHERRLELERRTPLIARIMPWMLELCRRSKCGIATDIKDDHYVAGRTFFCPEGRVDRCLIDVERVDIERVTPWKDLSSEYLDGVARRRWKPFREKNVLDIIAERVSMLVG